MREVGSLVSIAAGETGSWPLEFAEKGRETLSEALNVMQATFVVRGQAGQTFVVDGALADNCFSALACETFARPGGTLRMSIVVNADLEIAVALR